MRALVLLMLLAGVAHADSWGRAQSRSWHSPDESFVVEVFVPESRHNPAESGAMAYAYRVTSRTPTLQAKLVWKGPLANRWAPYAAIVTNDGYLVTLDDWGGLGSDHALAIYSPAGKLVRDYHLDKLAVPESVRNLDRSVSSRNWRRGAVYYANAKRKRLQLHLIGGVLEVWLADGKQRWIDDSPKQPPLDDLITINETALKFATLTDLVKP
jgi:hypothetical protein